MKTRMWHQLPALHSCLRAWSSLLSRLQAAPADWRSNCAGGGLINSSKSSISRSAISEPSPSSKAVFKSGQSAEGPTFIAPAAAAGKDQPDPSVCPSGEPPALVLPADGRQALTLQLAGYFAGARYYWALPSTAHEVREALLDALPLSDLWLGRELGSGGFARVLQAWLRGDLEAVYAGKLLYSDQELWTMGAYSGRSHHPDEAPDKCACAACLSSEWLARCCCCCAIFLPALRSKWLAILLSQRGNASDPSGFCSKPQSLTGPAAGTPACCWSSRPSGAWPPASVLTWRRPCAPSCTAATWWACSTASTPAVAPRSRPSAPCCVSLDLLPRSAA